MLIDTTKSTESPQYWMDRRKWTKFLTALPTDGKGRAFFAQTREDMFVIRVRASQINKSQNDVKFVVTLDLDNKVVTITKSKKEDA